MDDATSGAEGAPVSTPGVPAGQAAAALTPTTDAHTDGLISGRYRLGDLLGTGGSASVFAAVDTASVSACGVGAHRGVALKMLREADSPVASNSASASRGPSR